MTKKIVRNSLESVKGCCITTDGWTSCANTMSNLFITLWWVQQTAENMGNELKIIICEWNKHGKIVAVASDNAENIVAAIKLLKI